MAISFELTAQTREKLGTGASRRLRNLKKQVTANLYGSSVPTQHFALNHNELERYTKHDAFYSSILTLKIDGVSHKAVVKELQNHPVKPKMLNISFLRVDDEKFITLPVPLHFVGENVAPGIKQGGGTISYQLTNITLHCLPKDLPEDITVDISNLGLNDPITLSKLQLPEGVSLVPGPDKVVVTILAPRGQSTAATTATPSETSTA